MKKVDYRKIPFTKGTMPLGGVHPDENCRVAWTLSPVTWQVGANRAVRRNPKPITAAEAAKLIGYWKKNSTRFKRANPEESTLLWMKRSACRHGVEEIETPQGYLTARRQGR